MNVPKTHDSSSPHALACPSETYWRGFLSGQADATDVPRIDDHLAQCETCRKLLDDLSADAWIAPLLHERLSREASSGPKSSPGP